MKRINKILYLLLKSIMNPKKFLEAGNKLNLKIDHLGEQNSTVVAE